MKGLFSSLLLRVALWIARGYRRVSIELLKIEGARLYVQGVGTARKAFLSVLLLSFCLILASSGFLLFHIGLFLLLPPRVNAVTLLILGAVYLIVAVLALRWAGSEKTWMKYSNAAKYVAQATQKTPPP